ncbi:MAG: sensor histidine kinase [Gaiellaceae bacterium]
MSSPPNESILDPRAVLQLAGPAPPAAAAEVDGAAGLLLRRIPIGVVSVTEGLRVEYANPAAVAYLGAGVGELLPEPWPLVSLRKFAVSLFTDSPPARRIIETRGGRLLELDGVPAQASTTALLLIADVTARERRDRAEREFVSNAAHELRTPIAAIASAVEVLQGGAKDEPSERDLFLGHVSRQSERLSRLSEALLLLARIQTGDGVTTLRLVEVRPLLDEIKAELDLGDGVDLRISCEDGLCVFADRDLLRQAILNIAVNARRYTAAGEIVLTGRDLGRLCEIEVRDTGPGMSELDQKRVFERFFRVDGSAPGGFGLGLPIAREIVRALGGTVELDSIPGNGTRVRLRLPAARVVQK